jgi:hypothetical protein
MSASVPPEVRKWRQELHKRKLREAARQALADGPVFDPKSLDRSRYFPHQSEREINRATRYQST